MYKERLKELREINELKQKDIAVILNIDASHYGHLENEHEIMPIKHMNTLCNYFHISFDYLFNFTNEMTYSKSHDEINSIEIGKRLKEFRRENKLTQVKLASELNTVHPVITNYENGKNLIATPFLYTICKKYKISADYLLGKINSPRYLK